MHYKGREILKVANMKDREWIHTTNEWPVAQAIIGGDWAAERG
jgi:hypothetical protein